MPQPAPNAATLLAAEADLYVRAFVLARRYVTAAVEDEAPRVQLPEPGQWHDTRPMLDEREHAPQSVDLARQVLDYGLLCGLLHRHTQQPHLVRLVNAQAA
jgi:hypothetical protein